MSRVDVIIPCYKYGRYLPVCVASVLGQEGVDVRALVLDDASPDDSGEVAERLAAADRRLAVRRHPTNRGHIATYNEGLQWASADYTLLISADDLLAPGALSRAARFMDQHPEVALTYGRQIVFEGEPPSPEPQAGDGGGEIVPGPAFIERCCATAGNPVTTPTVVVRTALQRELGGYDAALPHTADLEMWLRFATRGAVGVLDRVQALKRAHGKNMQRQYVDTATADLRQRQAAFEAFFAAHGAGVPDRPRLEQSARRGLGECAFWEASKAFDRGDAEASRVIADYAASVYPALTARRQWSRYRWKRRLGPGLWGALRPWIDYLRGGAA